MSKGAGGRPPELLEGAVSASFFEGPEKKLELVVEPGVPSLRSLGPRFWTDVVEAAGAAVLSHKANAHFDAYLLSESSLFVYDDVFTLITCGQTTIVDALERFLRDVPPDRVAMLVYERKREHFPHRQRSSFFDDALRLRAMFEGRALRFGTEHEHAVRMFCSSGSHRPAPDDRTLEVLMHGIDPAVAARFSRGANPAEQLPRALGGFAIDEHVFEPTGYSLNALRDRAYATLHVTPEPVGSYVSFETNAGFGRDASGLVTEVVRCFSPEAFDVIAFEPDAAAVVVEVPGYRLRAHVQEPVSGYHVTFQHFYRPPASVSRAFEITLDDETTAG